MFFHNIPYVTVIIAAIASAAFGFVWYSPWLFGKLWMKEMGIESDKVDEFKKHATIRQKAGMYAGPLGLSLVTAFIMGALLNSLVVTSVGGYIALGASVWIGFSMPVAANSALFGKDNLILFAVNAGYQLANLVMVALIIGIWG